MFVFLFIAVLDDFLGKSNLVCEYARCDSNPQPCCKSEFFLSDDIVFAFSVSHYIERHFSAESEADRNEWIEAIHRVCHSGESDVILPIPRFAHTTSGGTTSGTGSQHDYTNESSATSSPYLNNHAATSNTPLTSSDDSLSRNQATHLSQSQHSSASNLRSTHQSLPVYPTYDDFDKLKVNCSESNSVIYVDAALIIVGLGTGNTFQFIRQLN